MPAQQPADPNGKPSIYIPINASGGEGGYMFTDLAHLDSVIAQWQTSTTTSSRTAEPS